MQEPAPKEPCAEPGSVLARSSEAPWGIPMDSIGAQPHTSPCSRHQPHPHSLGRRFPKEQPNPSQPQAGNPLQHPELGSHLSMVPQGPGLSHPSSDPAGPH